MLRISIGGSDFDTEQWAYNQLPANDLFPTNFTFLGDSDIRKVQQIHAIKKAANIKDVKIFGSAWSPPPWMKSWGGWSTGSLNEQYYQTWANYHEKFLNLMSDQKLPLWAISSNSERLRNYLDLNYLPGVLISWKIFGYPIGLAIG